VFIFNATTKGIGSRCRGNGSRKSSLLQSFSMTSLSWDNHIWLEYPKMVGSREKAEAVLFTVVVGCIRMDAGGFWCCVRKCCGWRLRPMCIIETHQ